MQLMSELPSTLALGMISCLNGLCFVNHLKIRQQCNELTAALKKIFVSFDNWLVILPGKDDAAIDVFVDQCLFGLSSARKSICELSSPKLESIVVTPIDAP